MGSCTLWLQKENAIVETGEREREGEGERERENAVIELAERPPPMPSSKRREMWA